MFRRVAFGFIAAFVAWALIAPQHFERMAGAASEGGNSASFSWRGARTGRTSRPAPAKRVSVTGSADGQISGQ